MYPPPGMPQPGHDQHQGYPGSSAPPGAHALPMPMTGSVGGAPTSPLYGAPPPPGPGPLPFYPGAAPPPGPQGYSQHQQQPYAPPYNPAAYQPPPPGQQFYPPPQHPGAPGDPGAGFGLNPLSLMAAGNLLSGGQHWGQQYMQKVQQRVGSFTGGALNFHFAISRQYVLSKLLMLVAPYLKKWTYTRMPEQMQGASQYKPPRVDVNCPDLYIPAMGLWTYALVVAAAQAAKGKFKPDNMYALVWSGLVAWAVHLLVARVILRAMSLPSSVPWVELAAYTGYTFVPVVASVVAGQLGGRWAYYGAWLYGSLCMAVFMVRTMKRVIFQEARGYGRDLTLTNYLLLALALFQFPYAFYLGVRP